MSYKLQKKKAGQWPGLGLGHVANILGMIRDILMVHVLVYQARSISLTSASLESWPRPLISEEQEKLI